MNGRIEPHGLGPELERTDRRRRHGEGLEGEIDGAEQRELDELQIAVIARGELGGDAERLGETRLRGGGAAAHQLEDIQVTLLRHDRGTGRELLRSARKPNSRVEKSNTSAANRERSCMRSAISKISCASPLPRESCTAVTGSCTA